MPVDLGRGDAEFVGQNSCRGSQLSRQILEANVNLVGSLDKSDAMLFSRLCGFGFTIAQNFDPLIFNTDHKIYSDAGIHFGGISHLESTGLIQFSVADYYRTGISQKGFVYYFGHPVWIEFPQGQKKHQLPIGQVLLTKAGAELATLSGAQPREGFVDFVKNQWKRFGIKTEQQTVQSTTGEAESGSPPAG